MVYLGQWLRFTRAHIISLGTFGATFFLCSCSSDTLRFSKNASPSVERTQWASYERLNSGLIPPAAIGVHTPTSYENASNQDVGSQSDVYPAPPPHKQPSTQRFFALPAPPEPQTQQVVREKIPLHSAAPLESKKVNSAAFVTPNKPLSDRPNKMESDPKGWTSEGGTWVLTSKGDSIKRLSERYGVPSNVIENMNALPHESFLKPGMNIIIPVYRGAPSQRVHQQKETKFVSLNESRAPVAPMSSPVDKPEASLPSPGQSRPESLPLKAGNVSSVPDSPQPESSKKSEISPPVVAAGPPLQEGVASTAASRPLRWPVRGRVITQFNVGGNEGINIAVPVGTPVKAAEDGVVAYAGEELKGYGKLILVRHANGLISAYAHNSSLLVTKGDKVRRGQDISVSGQTGSVSSPQLHFEVRQGAVPIDPIPRLESHNNF